MIRKDIHRPSAIVPADYEFVAFEYIKLEAGDILGNCDFIQSERAVKTAHMERTGGTYAQHEHGGSCHVCGANAIYTVLFYHEASNSYIRTGQDCAQKMEMPYDELRYNAFRKAVTDARLAIAGKRKAEAILNDKGFSSAWTIYNQTDAEVTAKYEYEERTIVDIVGKLVKYGSSSDRAVNYVGALLNKIADRATLQARRAAEMADAAPCPTGKVQITGTVLSTKIQDGYYGRTLKMLVKDDSGFKVWGTVPSSINVERETRVTFSATVEPSKDDTKFGFFSRPTKAVVVEPTPTPEHEQRAEHSYMLDGYIPTIVVACTECGVDYEESTVTILDIEEDIQGRDVLHFTCPKGHTTKGLRRG